MVVDARGLSCPQPVVEAKKAVAAGGKEIEIFLDNSTSITNVTRFMTNQGYQLTANDVQPDQSNKLVFVK